MIIKEDWGSHPQHFWLLGRRPERVVEFDERLGTWNVFGYPEAITALSDPRRFSSEIKRIYPPGYEDPFDDGNILQMDPPAHRKLRNLVSHGFTPKIVADLQPRIAALTSELLDEVAGRDEFELVEALAQPLPVIVIAELLGVPASDRELFRNWVDDLFSNTEQVSLNEVEAGAMAEAAEQAHAKLLPMVTYLGEHAAERRGQPREDLLSKLVHATVDGERLTDREIVNFAMLLLVAGHITTTLLLGNTMLCLDAHPDAAARVRADRSLVPGAIEESLRLVSPFPGVARVSTTEVELGGVTVPANQLIMVWGGAANRDDRQFTDPQVFRPDRDPNPHLGLGRGIHFCLGAPLARLEGRVALNILFDRFPALRADPATPPVFRPSPDMSGVKTLPLRTSV
ncbi:cytochrome P450 [Actinocrispum sp. NPDC049592]|uniref:cytochrome P450 n=1 Tax=Actinocrispum sp. NPDC049592 TaxID=3154835 RepID=UPI00342E4B62